jgi:hypothetical protein
MSSSLISAYNIVIQNATPFDTSFSHPQILVSAHTKAPPELVAGGALRWSG